MKIVIVEDEAPAFRRLQKIIEEVVPEAQILEVFDTVSETVAWFKLGLKVDLVFLDIQLSDGISLDIFDQVDIHAPIIFTTAFDEYLLDAFKVNSVDYLLKPIKPSDLAKSLAKLRQFKELFATGTSANLQEALAELKESKTTYKKRFLVKQGQQLISIQTEDVALFYIKRGVLHLITFDQKDYLIDHTLDEVTSQLDPSVFYRANRQCTVNISLIQSAERYHKGKIIVKTSFAVPEDITISEEKASHFKQWLDQ